MFKPVETLLDKFRGKSTGEMTIVADFSNDDFENFFADKDWRILDERRAEESSSGSELEDRITQRTVQFREDGLKVTFIDSNFVSNEDMAAYREDRGTFVFADQMPGSLSISRDGLLIAGPEEGQGNLLENLL